jgi:hypothetical protein
MAVNILTKEDLSAFKEELFEEIRTVLLQSPHQQKKWLKTDEVRKLLKVSPGTLQTLRVNGTLAWSKLGGIIYYDADHIQKILAENARPVQHPVRR